MNFINCWAAYRWTCSRRARSLIACQLVDDDSVEGGSQLRRWIGNELRAANQQQQFNEPLPRGFEQLLQVFELKISPGSSLDSLRAAIPLLSQVAGIVPAVRVYRR